MGKLRAYLRDDPLYLAPPGANGSRYLVRRLIAPGPAFGRASCKSCSCSNMTPITHIHLCPRPYLREGPPERQITRAIFHTLNPGDMHGDLLFVREIADLL